jgi:hypothetical protein
MYVRKYDPPLFINSQEMTQITSEMADIIAGNSGGSLSDVTNEGIMKHIKENIGEFSGFVDVLGMYSTK